MYQRRRYEVAQHFRWAVPLLATLFIGAIMALDFGFSAEPWLRMAILGIPAACAITALIFGWSLRYKPLIAPVERWTQASFDGDSEITCELSCRGPKAAIPRSDEEREDYAKRLGWVATYGRKALAVVDKENPVENAPQLLAEATAAQKDKAAAEERSQHLQDESAAKDERIKDLLTTVKTLAKVGATPATQPSTQPQSAERPQRRDRREEPRKERPAREKKDRKKTDRKKVEPELPGSDNIGICDLCEDSRKRRRYRVTGARRRSDSEPEDMDVCVGSCSKIAVKEMGGTIVGAKEAQTDKQTEAAAEAVET